MNVIVNEKIINPANKIIIYSSLEEFSDCKLMFYNHIEGYPLSATNSNNLTFNKSAQVMKLITDKIFKHKFSIISKDKEIILGTTTMPDDKNVELLKHIRSGYKIEGTSHIHRFDVSIMPNSVIEAVNERIKSNIDKFNVTPLIVYAGYKTNENFNLFIQHFEKLLEVYSLIKKYENQIYINVIHEIFGDVHIQTSISVQIQIIGINNDVDEAYITELLRNSKILYK